MKIAVFIFRRDFRLFDNLGVVETFQLAIDKNYSVLPIFIFSADQGKESTYFNVKSFRFMLESLANLKKDCPALKFFKLTSEQSDSDILDKINANHSVGLVGFNADVTPYAIRRDRSIKAWCATQGIHCSTQDDYTFHSLSKVRNLQGNPYQVFTPFKKMAQGFTVEEPKASPENVVYFKSKIECELSDDDIEELCPPDKTADSVLLHGSRKKALEILQTVRDGKFKK